MVLVGYDQEQHDSFRDFHDCEELRYLTLLVPLKSHHRTRWFDDALAELQTIVSRLIRRDFFLSL